MKWEGRFWGWLAMTLVCAALASGQSVRSLVNSGNDLYERGEYQDAEVNYRKALEKDAGQMAGRFNLGNALYKEGKQQESISEYEMLLRPTTEPKTQADVYYNIGNSYLRGEQYEQAIAAYIEALKRDPGDMDAKYNLSYALKKRKEQQQQQKQNTNDKDKKDNKQQKQDQQQKNQQQQQQQQQQRQQQQQQQQQQNQQQRASSQEKKMSKADAERILQVLRNNERDVQKRLRVRQAVRPKGEKDW